MFHTKSVPVFINISVRSFTSKHSSQTNC